MNHRQMDYYLEKIANKKKVKISAVINTKNEQRNLPRLLKSLEAWIDEIIICDMQSTDKTCEIAQNYGCKILMHEDIGYVEPARKLAVQSARNDWILLLDADELINAKLRHWIQKNFKQTKRIAFDSVELAYVQYMSGQEIKFSDFGKQKHIRLFKKSKYQFSDKIHSRRIPIDNPTLFSLPAKEGAIVHFNCGSFKRFLDKINHYAYVEASEIVVERRGYQFSLLKGLYAFSAKFFNVYIKCQGYKDGLHGLHISLCMALYSFLVRSYAHEITQMGTEQAIQAHYDKLGKENI